MTDNLNVFTAFRANEPSSQVVESGDVALVIKTDGSVQALTFGYDRKRLLAPESEHSDEDRAMMKQGEKLFALALAASNPRLLALLVDIANDPDVVDRDVLADLVRCH